MLPPFTDIRSVQTLIDADHLTIGYGAQDCLRHDTGAFTGEVSGAMLAKLGLQLCDSSGTPNAASTTARTSDVVAAKAQAARVMA